MTLRGTKTASNLITAFAGESQAAQRYTLAASIADKAGYKHIAAIFKETAENEKVHANTYYKYLKDEFKLEPIELNPDYTAFPVVYGDVADCLQGAIDGENEEATDMYPKLGEIAREEGFEDIAVTFTEIAEVEEHHRDRFQTLLDNYKNGTTFKKSEPTVWKCLHCGYIHEGLEVPELCPSCKHAQGYFADMKIVY